MLLVGLASTDAIEQTDAVVVAHAGPIRRQGVSNAYGIRFGQPRYDFIKGPAQHSFELASETDRAPSLNECRECPDHPGVRLKLNLSMVPICAVPGCDYGP